MSTNTTTSEIATEDDMSQIGMPMFLTGRKPGWNVDPINVRAGLARLATLGWDPLEDLRTFMVIEHALNRWRRGEEQDAEKGAIDKSFYGIDLTSWRAVLASAIAQGHVDLQAADAETGAQA